MFLLFPDMKEIHTVGTVKGLAFVVATSLILFGLLRREQSEQKRKQHEIHTLNALLQSVLEPIEDVLLVIDGECRIHYHTKGAVNVATSRVSLRDGESLWHAIATPFSNAIRPGIEQVLATGADQTLEFEDEERRLWFARIYAIPTGACLLLRDVSQRRTEERALRLSEMRYRALIDHANDGILTIQDGIFSSCNPSACRMLGYTEHDIVGRSPTEISPTLQAEGVPSILLAKEYMEKALSGASLVFEWVHTHRNGSTVVIEVSLNRISPEGEEFLLCIWRDVTLRRQYENDLIESRFRLRALAARLDEVREEERIRLSREIHDGLGQSLTGLKIDVSLLKRALLPEHPIADSVAEVVTSMERILDETISQTRQLARKLRPGMLEEVGISEAIRQFMMEFRQRSGMTVSLQLSSSSLPIPPRQQLALYRITQEAITNIVRHAVARRVEVSLDLVAGMAMLEVRDDGKGLSPDDLVKSGSLGIVGMCERAELLGGFCHILPRDGGGTVVHVELPLAADAGLAGKP
ncbi:MAG: PAS domain S-box protein [Bacteroidetes bacterium]|nr:PAS domain S-box protein [Bacteroidota bacterium]